MKALMLRDGQIERRVVRAAAGISSPFSSASCQRGARSSSSHRLRRRSSRFFLSSMVLLLQKRGAEPCFKGQQTRSEYPPLNAHRATRRTRETGLSRGLSDLQPLLITGQNAKTRKPPLAPQNLKNPTVFFSSAKKREALTTERRACAQLITDTGTPTAWY